MNAEFDYFLSVLKFKSGNTNNPTLCYDKENLGISQKICLLGLISYFKL